jgi:hypothetical protein
MAGPIIKEGVKRLVRSTVQKKKKKPTQALFNNRLKDRQVKQGNIGTRNDPDTGTTAKYSTPKPGETPATKGKYSVEAEQGITANKTQSQQKRANKYERLKAKQKRGKTPLTAEEKRFIKNYDITEIDRTNTAEKNRRNTMTAKKPIAVAKTKATPEGKVMLSPGRTFKSYGGKVTKKAMGGKIGRGCGAALRGGGKVMR